ncbi:hypothetical protein ACRU3B_16570 [Mycobacterium colombiense]
MERLIRSGQLPVRRFGPRLVRIATADLDAFGRDA